MEHGQNNTVKRRRRRFFDSIVNWIGDNIVEPVVETVVDLVETPVQVAKALGAVIAGDMEKAKEEILEIGIVEDTISLAENAIEFGQALWKGDLSAVGDALLGLGLDALSFVPIPGGRLVGKVGSEAIENAIKRVKTRTKSKSKDRKDDDNEKSDDEKQKQCSIGEVVFFWMIIEE